MSDRIILSDSDVASMAEDASLAGTSTSTSEELMEIVRSLVLENTDLPESESLDWVADGVICKVLLAQGGGWQKGKVRLCIEFIPDEPRSPLADLRSGLDIQSK